jgi:SPP1 family predicted phage head-tail adaptor
MQAGRLRHPITIQSVTRAPDDSGTPVDTWTDHAQVWSEAMAVGGSETVRGRQVHAEATMLFFVRHRSDITVDMRVSWQGRLWGLVYAGDPYGDEKWLRLEAKAQV